MVILSFMFLFLQEVDRVVKSRLTNSPEITQIIDIGFDFMIKKLHKY